MTATGTQRTCRRAVLTAASDPKPTFGSPELDIAHPWLRGANDSSDGLTLSQSCNNLCYMKRDSRLSDVLHVLLHMARQEGPVTSEVLAKAMRTNPVVLRRTMAGLRNQGLVRSEKGHGGGWTIACDLSAVTMLDIYLALGKPPLFALGNRSDAPDCLVEKAVNANLNQALLDAEQSLMARFGEVALSKLSADLQIRVKQRRDALDVEKVHGGSA